MKTSSLVLLPLTTSGADVTGTPQKAVAYYTKDKGLQTVNWQLTDIVGVVTIEATLDELNDTDNYFPVHTIDASGGPSTLIGFTNLTGKYTWIRATVTNFTAGTVDTITLGY